MVDRGIFRGFPSGTNRREIASTDNSPKILIVDDDVGVTMFFKLCLEENGFTVKAYNNPIDVLANFEPHIYDLLLIDIRMPQMTGFQLVQKIRQSDSSAKVCFVSAFPAYYDSLKEEFPELGMECFIVKPIASNELLRHVRLHLTTKE